MMTTVASSSTPSPSLLSRIGPSASATSLTRRMDTTRSKRNSTEEENERSRKRRRSNKDFHTSQNTRFTSCLSTGDASDTQVIREEKLHNELLQFVDYISPSKQEREARIMLVSSIEMLLQTRWSDAQVIVFGSCATDLGLAGGDIDLVVSFDSSSTLSDSGKKRRLTAIGDVLRRSGMTKWVNRIFGARVPIITFVTTEDLGGVSIDISMRNYEDTGVRAISLVKQYLTDMPALRPLILAIKALLSLRELNDASQGTLSSYAITLMCISFLQRNPTRRHQKQLDEPLVEKSLGLLLMDFFRHYGHDFSYATHYISVSDRGIFPKKLKNWETKAGNRAVLAVQCILNPESNITRGCGKIAMIVEAFKDALHVLQNTPFDNSGDHFSLLCHIYEVPEENHASRQFLDNAVDSGAFSGAVASCISEVRRPPIGGGVSLSSRPGPRREYSRDERNLQMRLLPGRVQMLRNPSDKRHAGAATNDPDSVQNVQRLPVQRRHDVRNQHPNSSSISTTQFDFQPQLQQFHGIPTNYAAPDVQGRRNTGLVRQELCPSQHSIPKDPYRHNRFSNDLSHAIFNHLAPQQNRNSGWTHNIRH